MFISSIKTRNYNEKFTLDTWSKQTQSNPISNGGQAGIIRAGSEK
jgi:hypothetical protein